MGGGAFGEWNNYKNYTRYRDVDQRGRLYGWVVLIKINCETYAG